MFCKNCGAQLESTVSFCPNCGTKQEGTEKKGNAQTFLPNDAAASAIMKKKKPVWIVPVAVILLVGIVFLVINMFVRNAGQDLSRFDKKNNNTISTSWFEEFASDKSEFEMYFYNDYRNSENPSGHAVVEQRGLDIDHNSPIECIYLATYENADELKENAFKDILNIVGIDGNIAVLDAIKSSSEDFYYFNLTGDGVYTNHTSNCFCLTGNSMVYAISNTGDAYDYLLEKDSAEKFNVPVFDQEENSLMNFEDQFIEAYNNR